MELKHTPGPWEVVPKTGGAIVTASGVSVGMANKSSFSFGQRLANARLMAAAPQLLEALMLWERIDALAYTQDFASDMEMYNTAMKATKAAIASATGE